MASHHSKRRPAATPSLGLELEFAVACLVDGHSFDARGAFEGMRDRQVSRHVTVDEIVVDGQIVSLESEAGVFSVDNGFNNLEYAFAPRGPQFGHGDTSGLNELAAVVHDEVNTVLEVLADEGAAVLNLSEHPSTLIDDALYQRLRAPKAMYGHWVGDRLWRHEQGMDAKAQNGPTTGVGVDDAVNALNLILNAAPAMIALFGNSPFEANRVTGLLENRLTIWSRMFAHARTDADRR